jgi:hypothetical protein
VAIISEIKHELDQQHTPEYANLTRQLLVCHASQIPIRTRDCCRTVFLDSLTSRRHTQRLAYVMTADACRRHYEWLAAMPSNGSMPC